MDEIAESQGVSTPKLLSLLHDEALELTGDVSNFASLLRTTCLLYLRGGQPVPEDLVALRTAAE